MSNSLSIIMAHTAAQDTVDRHIEHWRREKSDLMFTAPQNAMIQSWLPVIGIGIAAHHGPASIQRFREILRFMSHCRYDWFTLHEYDSVCLGPKFEIADPASIYGNVFDNSDPRFLGRQFIHPPLSMSRYVLELVLQGFERVGDDCEKSFWDRALGFVCERSKIPIVSYGRGGFSRNTIERSLIPMAVEARAAGATMFHGVKTAEVLRSLS